MQTRFNISNHPIAPNVSRKIHIVGPFPDFRKEYIQFPVDIEHYVDGVLSEQFFKTERVALLTSNEKFVNALGQRVVVEPDIIIVDGVEKKVYNLPDGVFGEFDFLFSYKSQNINATLGETLMEVIAFMIQRNDDAGNFNDLSNFYS